MAGTPTTPGEGRKSAQGEAYQKYKRQRDTLQRLLDQNEMTPAGLARIAGLKRPNAIYNFLNGRSYSFSQRMLGKISEALKVSVETLLCLESHSCDLVYQSLTVRTTAALGVWRVAFDLPTSEQFPAPVGAESKWASSGAYAVLVNGRGAENLYHRGTILTVVPLDRWGGVLAAKRRVILQRIREKVEVTVREIEVKDGRAWLWPRSNDPSDPECLIPIEMPWPSAVKMWKRGDERFLIAGVVVQALIPEE